MDNIDFIFIGVILANFLLNTGRGLKAIELCNECLVLLNIRGIEEQYVKLFKTLIYGTMFNAYYLIGDYTNATKNGRELLVHFRELGERAKEGDFTLALANIYERQCKHEEAKELYERAINIMIETGDRKREARAYEQCGTLCYNLGDYVKAKQYMEKEVAIRIEIGDRKGEARSYEQCGAMFIYLGEYVKAKEYLEKALAIRMETADKEGEAADHGYLGTVFERLGEYAKAQEYHEKALANTIETGNREGEATSYGKLGTLFFSNGKYAKAKKCIEKSLAIRMEIGDRNGQATDYGILGIVFISLSEYEKAQEHIEKGLAIRMEIGDRVGQAGEYGNLGTVFYSLGKYTKAQEYIEKSLAIKIEIGDRKGEAVNYGNLGAVFRSLGKYAKAQEYLEKALAIRKEIGDREGEAVDYGHLGTVFKYLGEYTKAQEYIEKALAIRMEIGDRNGQAADYGNLGSVIKYFGEYSKAQEHIEKALVIRKEIGDREGEATDYGNLGILFQFLGEYVKAKEYHEKALAIRMEIGDKVGEAAESGNLGTTYLYLGECAQAKEYYEKAVCRDTGYSEGESACIHNLFFVELYQGKVQEAFNYLLQSIRKWEELRVFLEDNDQFKISFSDVHLNSYHKFSDFFCAYGNPNDALCVEELRRARALADLMAAQYSLGNKQIASYPRLWIENIMKKERNSICLYITYRHQDVLVWILKANGSIFFRKIKVNEEIVGVALVPNLDDFFAKSFRSFGVLPEENCEDRSLNVIEEKLESSLEESITALRLLEDDDDECQNPESSLSLCYRMVIGPVVDLLEEPEIIIVPDRSLNQVPFAALSDEGGKYLSETFRIRIVPSLSVLRLIQDSPADYHSQTGALIVGDPRVGLVFYKGCLENFKPLPCARKEAEMVGRLLGVQPLLAECATKRAVLDVIGSVSLIHIAAHGNAERGEIALAPIVRVASMTPQDDDYLLTMTDISKVRLRAKLVVLSCCHSGRGQIRAEGVVGIARAFLGSGARSVLVALWALGDSATEQLMSRFYEHLAHGESASESLHEAMKWMRENDFPKIADWAPFMLIGDNVKLEFGKESK